MIEQMLQEAMQLVSNYKVEVKTKKNAKDLVTNVDIAIQQFITQFLQINFPDCDILGEESHKKVNIKKGKVWIIDPIDGTANFVKQKANFGMLLALVSDGKLVEGYIADTNTHEVFSVKKNQGVFLNGKPIWVQADLTLSDSLIYCNPLFALEKKELMEVFKKAFGVRYLAACSLDALTVIRQQAGCCIGHLAEVWDVAPTILLAEELNLKCVNFDGSKRQVDQVGPYIFGYPACVDEVVSILKEQV